MLLVMCDCESRIIYDMIVYSASDIDIPDNEPKFTFSIRGYNAFIPLYIIFGYFQSIITNFTNHAHTYTHTAAHTLIYVVKLLYIGFGCIS